MNPRGPTQTNARTGTVHAQARTDMTNTNLNMRQNPHRDPNPTPHEWDQHESHELHELLETENEAEEEPLR